MDRVRPFSERWRDPNFDPQHDDPDYERPPMSAAEIARMRALHDALEGLVRKLDAVHKDPSFINVWLIHQLHAGPYQGPTYTAELAAARAVLEERQ